MMRHHKRNSRGRQLADLALLGKPAVTPPAVFTGKMPVTATQHGVGFDFLGYHFEGATRWPRKKSLAKMKAAIRTKTKRCNGHSLERIIHSVNLTLRGWFGYFKHGRWWFFDRIDCWVRMRLRSILRKRRKGRGRGRGADHQRWTNAFFREHGLFSLMAAYESARQSSRR